MGCDIHFYVETRGADGLWKSVDTWVNDDGYIRVPYEKRFYDARNYDLFAILADVRNGYGFAGVKTGDGFNIISKPRGLPADVSPEVRACSDQWDWDGHSHSWFTVAELKAFDWNQETRHQGWVGESDFKHYIKNGKPNSWCGGVGGITIEKVSMTDMTDIIKGTFVIDRTKSYYTLVSWTEKYSDSVSEFLNETIPKMEKLGPTNDVRCVFWFDN